MLGFFVRVRPTWSRHRRRNVEYAPATARRILGFVWKKAFSKRAADCGTVGAFQCPKWGKRFVYEKGVLDTRC